MNTLEAKQQIEDVVDSIRVISFKQKIKSKDERINDFLDAILDIKQELLSQTSELNEITAEMEKLTWVNGQLDEECYKLLNELLVMASDVHYILIKNEYVPLNNIFRPNGIAVEELKGFKSALNDFKEAREDVDSVFFTLLKDKNFMDTTHKIANLLE